MWGEKRIVKLRVVVTLRSGGRKETGRLRDTGDDTGGVWVNWRRVHNCRVLRVGACLLANRKAIRGPVIFSNLLPNWVQRERALGGSGQSFLVSVTARNVGNNRRGWAEWHPSSPEDMTDAWICGKHLPTISYKITDCVKTDLRLGYTR